MVGESRPAISEVSLSIGVKSAITAAVTSTAKTPMAMVLAPLNSREVSCRSTPILRLTIGCISGAKSIAPMMTEEEFIKSPKVAIMVANINKTIKFCVTLLSSLRFLNKEAYCSWLACEKRGIAVLK